MRTQTTKVTKKPRTRTRLALETLESRQMLTASPFMLEMMDDHEERPEHPRRFAEARRLVDHDYEFRSSRRDHFDDHDHDHDDDEDDHRRNFESRWHRFRIGALIRRLEGGMLQTELEPEGEFTETEAVPSPIVDVIPAASVAVRPVETTAAPSLTTNLILATNPIASSLLPEETLPSSLKADTVIAVATLPITNELVEDTSPDLTVEGSVNTSSLFTFDGEGTVDRREHPLVDLSVLRMETGNVSHAVSVEARADSWAASEATSSWIVGVSVSHDALTKSRLIDRVHTADVSRYANVISNKMEGILSVLDLKELAAQDREPFDKRFANRLHNGGLNDEELEANHVSLERGPSGGEFELVRFWHLLGDWSDDTWDCDDATMEEAATEIDWEEAALVTPAIRSIDLSFDGIAEGEPMLAMQIQEVDERSPSSPGEEVVDQTIDLVEGIGGRLQVFEVSESNEDATADEAEAVAQDRAPTDRGSIGEDHGQDVLNHESSAEPTEHEAAWLPAVLLLGLRPRNETTHQNQGKQRWLRRGPLRFRIRSLLSFCRAD